MKTAPILVLYIEDDPSDVELAKAALEHSCETVPYNIIAMEEPTKALSFCERYHPDIILLDFNLPKMNGLDFLKSLRASRYCKDTPVIFITGMANPNFKKKAEESGVSAYFSKPIDFPSFKSVFQKICHEWFKPISEAKTA